MANETQTDLFGFKGWKKYDLFIFVKKEKRMKRNWTLVRVTADTHAKLKAFCAENVLAKRGEMTLTGVVETALEDFFQKNTKNP